jgi:predicted nucleic acid-binding protein
MRVLLDTNVVLDVLLMRTVWQAEAAVILDAARKSQIVAAFTSLSVANCFYVARRHGGIPMARLVVRECLGAFEILPIDRDTLLAAEGMPGTDFEDNIQIAAAIAARVEAIVTRDPAGFSDCVIPVFTPRQLAQQLARASGSTSSSA